MNTVLHAAAKIFSVSVLIFSVWARSKMRAWESTLIDAVGVLIGVLIGCWLLGSEPSLDKLSFAIAITALHGVTRLKTRETGETK
jgi:hypothetical protein